MRKQYNGVSYDTEIDYKKQYDQAVANGDYVLAAAIEKVRNAKIDGEGLSFAKTNNYSGYASPSESASPAVSKTNYGKEAERLLGRAGAMNFHYNAQKDPLYKQIQKNYKDTAGDVIENTMGVYAGMTGGVPSSYATSAAAQAGAAHLQKADDIIPELYQLAYSKFADDKADLYKQYGIMQGLEEQAYNREWEQKKWDYGVAQDIKAEELAKTKAEYDKEVSLAEIEAEMLKEGNDMQKQYFDFAKELVEMGTPPDDEIMLLAGLNMTGQQFYDNYVSESNRVLAQKNKYSPKEPSKELKRPTSAMFTAIDELFEEGDGVKGLPKLLSKYDWEAYDKDVIDQYIKDNYGSEAGVNAFYRNQRQNEGYDESSMTLEEYAKDVAYRLNQDARAGVVKIDKKGNFSVDDESSYDVINAVLSDESLTDEEAYAILDMYGITQKQLNKYVN